jgi:hypothetical protein
MRRRQDDLCPNRVSGFATKVRTGRNGRTPEPNFRIHLATEVASREVVRHREGGSKSFDGSGTVRIFYATFPDEDDGDAVHGDAAR